MASLDPGRPSLLFDAGDIPAIQRRAQGPSRAPRDQLVAFAEPRLSWSPPPLHGGYEKRGDQLQDPYLTSILAFATLALLTGEARHREAARRWALALAREPTWAGVTTEQTPCGNCAYAEAWGAVALAVVVDFLGAELPPSDRAELVGKLRLVTRGLHAGSQRGQWWTHAYLHHDTWVALGGLGLGALCLAIHAGSSVPEADDWARAAEREIAAALDWLGDDGAWPEGPAGWAFAMISVVPFLAALARRSPESPILSHPWLARTARFRLHARTPDGLFLGFGDSRETGGYQRIGDSGAPILRWLAARFRDPVAQWLAARERDARPSPFTAAWEILFTDPDLAEASPASAPEPTGLAFENQGIAYARTGWDGGATLVGLRGSSLLGRRAASLYQGRETGDWNNSTTHVHADAGAFGVHARGAFAVTMARYGQRETESQSSVLVDGRGQYSTFGPDHLGRPDGRLASFFTSRAASVLEGEAARAYPPGLTRFTRRLYLVAPGLVFLADDLAGDRPVVLRFRANVDLAATVRLHDRGFESLLGGHLTKLLAASPAALSLGVDDDDNNHGVLMTGARAAAATFVAALVPSAPSASEITLAAVSPRAFAGRALDAEVSAAFAAHGEESAASHALTVEGRAGIAVASARERVFLLHEGTRLDRDSRLVLAAGIASTLSLGVPADGTSTAILTVSAPSATTVRVDPGFAVGRARVAGGGDAALEAHGGSAAIAVPAGTTIVELMR